MQSRRYDAPLDIFLCTLPLLLIRENCVNNKNCSLPTCLTLTPPSRKASRYHPFLSIQPNVQQAITSGQLSCNRNPYIVHPTSPSPASARPLRPPPLLPPTSPPVLHTNNTRDLISPLLRDGNLGALRTVPVVRVVLRWQQAAAEVSLEPLPRRQVRIHDPEPATVDPDLLPNAEVSGGVDVLPGGGAGAVLSAPPTCPRLFEEKKLS